MKTGEKIVVGAAVGFGALILLVLLTRPAAAAAPVCLAGYHWDATANACVQDTTQTAACPF